MSQIAAVASANDSRPQRRISYSRQRRTCDRAPTHGVAPAGIRSCRGRQLGGFERRVVGGHAGDAAPSATAWTGPDTAPSITWRQIGGPTVSHEERSGDVIADL